MSDPYPHTTVAPNAYALTAGPLELWVRIPLKARMFVRVFIYVAVLCRYWPYDGLKTRPRSPAEYLNRFIISEIFTNWNGP